MKRAVIKKLIEHGCVFNEEAGELTFPARLLGLEQAPDGGTWYWNVDEITPEEAQAIEAGSYRYKLIYDEHVIEVSESAGHHDWAGMMDEEILLAQDEVRADEYEARWAARCRS